MSVNKAFSIKEVIEIIKNVMGPDYIFSIGGNDNHIIHITNTRTRKNNFQFIYNDSIDYSQFPWKKHKNLEYREHVGINATSERYCQYANPTEKNIQDFVKICFNIE